MTDQIEEAARLLRELEHKTRVPWRRRLWYRLYGHQRFAGIKLPGGVVVLSFTSNAGGLGLASRHPSWSITWLWFVQMWFGRGPYDPGVPWRARFRCRRVDPVCKQYHLSVGWLHLSFFWQESMARRPGQWGYNRKRWVAQCERIAGERADVQRELAYRRELSRLLEPVPCEKDEE